MRAQKSPRLFPFVAVMLCLLFAAPPSALAAFIPAEASAEADDAALDALRASLEDDLIASRLAQLGVSREQAQARLAALTPAEREQVAANLASIQAGGEVQVMVTFSTMVPVPLAVGLLLLWLMVLTFASASQGW